MDIEYQFILASKIVNPKRILELEKQKKPFFSERLWWCYQDSN